MNVNEIKSIGSSFVNKVGKVIPKGINNYNVLPVAESVAAGSVMALIDSMGDKDRAGHKLRAFKNGLGITLAAATAVPLNKAAQKYGNIIVSKMKPSLQSKGAEVLRCMKYMLPIINAITIAPLVVSRVIIPINKGIGKLVRDKNEDSEVVLSIRDYLKQPLEK